MDPSPAPAELVKTQRHQRGIWRLPPAWRRFSIALLTFLLTAIVCAVFVPYLFVGPADWLVAVAAVLVLALALYGHFNWLIWMAGFVGWRTRPREVFGSDEPIHTRTALVMPIYHEEANRVAQGIGRTWLARTGVFACHRSPEDLETMGELACTGSDCWWTGSQKINYFPAPLKSAISSQTAEP